MWVVFDYSPDVWNIVGIFDTRDEAIKNMCKTSLLFDFNSNEKDNLKEFMWSINLVRKNIVKDKILSDEEFDKFLDECGIGAERFKKW